MSIDSTDDSIASAGAPLSLTTSSLPSIPRGDDLRQMRLIALAQQDDWQIERDAIAGRTLDLTRKFLPDGLSLVARLDFMSPDDRLWMSHVQGRSYVYLLGVLERFIGARMMEATSAFALGDSVTLAVALHIVNDEWKHQQLFRRIEQLMMDRMPVGYVMTADADAVATAVLSAHEWSVLALINHIELYVQAHYEQSIAWREDMCPVFKDALRFHWRDECQHAAFDEIDWASVNDRVTDDERNRAVDQFIALIRLLDAVLAEQSKADAEYFGRHARARFTAGQRSRIESALFAAYRWQFIVSGMQHMRFSQLLGSKTTCPQRDRISAALKEIMRI